MAHLNTEVDQREFRKRCLDLLHDNARRFGAVAPTADPCGVRVGEP